MASENHVRLRGVLKSNALVHNDKDGNVNYVSFTINVAKPLNRMSEEAKAIAGTSLIEQVYIMSSNPVTMQKMRELKEFDIVDVVGIVVTRKQLKAHHCDHCGKRQVVLGTATYVYPVFVEHLGRVDDDEEASDYLRERNEISNSLRAIGKVKRGPKLMHRTSYDPLDFTQYQIVLRRKFYLGRSVLSAFKVQEHKVDYPWVKSYGSNAIFDRVHLLEGSIVYIDGYLQHRQVTRHSFCGQLFDKEKGQYLRKNNGDPVIEVNDKGEQLGCGAETRWNDRVLEIVPLSTEYLSAFRNHNEAMDFVQEALNKAVGSYENIENILKEHRMKEDEITAEDIDNGIDTGENENKVVDQNY